MMFDDIFRAKDIAENIGGLLNNRGIRNDINNTLLPIFDRMF